MPEQVAELDGWCGPACGRAVTLIFWSRCGRPDGSMTTPTGARHQLRAAVLDRSSTKLPAIPPREFVSRNQGIAGVRLDRCPERTGHNRQRTVGNHVEVRRQLAVDDYVKLGMCRGSCLSSSSASGTAGTLEITLPSTCISANCLSSVSTSMKVGANTPGIEAEATSTRRNRSSRPGWSLAATTQQSSSPWRD